jgi:hypothetical protein
VARTYCAVDATVIGGPCDSARPSAATAPPSSVMKSRRLIWAPLLGLRAHITTALRKNAAVHHGKNCALMSQLGVKSGGDDRVTRRSLPSNPTVFGRRNTRDLLLCLGN